MLVLVLVLLLVALLGGVAVNPFLFLIAVLAVLLFLTPRGHALP